MTDLHPTTLLLTTLLFLTTTIKLAYQNHTTRQRLKLNEHDLNNTLTALNDTLKQSDELLQHADNDLTEAQRILNQAKQALEDSEATKQLTDQHAHLIEQAAKETRSVRAYVTWAQQQHPELFHEELLKKYEQYLNQHNQPQAITA